MFNGSIGVELDSEGSIVSACTEHILKMLHHLFTHQGHNVPVSAHSPPPPPPPSCSTFYSDSTVRDLSCQLALNKF